MKDSQLSYCFSCKQYTGNKDEKVVTAKNGSRMKKSTCVKCLKGKSCTLKQTLEGSGAISTLFTTGFKMADQMAQTRKKKKLSEKQKSVDKYIQTITGGGGPSIGRTIGKIHRKVSGYDKPEARKQREERRKKFIAAYKDGSIDDFWTDRQYV